LLAEGDFAFEGEEVDTFADVAIADGFDVFLGILGVHGILLLDRL
jgi:hypothetical protein